MDQTDRLAALERIIALGRGELPADLLLRNAQLVNVLSGEIHPADIAVADGVVIGFGDYQARRTIDCQGRHVCPGLIDGHIHIESTMLTPWEFARAAAPRGTCAVVWDPHEIANVMGPDGVDLMLELTKDSLLTFYVMIPSCVPATAMETSGGVVTAQDIARLAAGHPRRVLGLAELMNYPGVLGRDRNVLAKILACDCRLVDGHAPMLTGKDLNAYILAGPSSDHESTTAQEALEKLRLGLHLLLREGSFEKNLVDLLPVVTKANAQSVSMACDDRDPVDLMTLGHMDHNVRLAISKGLPAVRAVQMASLNTARHYGLSGRGAVAPGYRADLIVLDDLETFVPWKVFLAGEDVAELDFRPEQEVPAPNTVHISSNGGQISKDDFSIVKVKDEVRCIGVMPGQLITEHITLRPRFGRIGDHGQPPLQASEAAGIEVVQEQGTLVALADPSRDLAKLAVIERHTGSGRIGLGFVQGLGLARGAVAGTVGHDSHNLIVAGVDEADMAVAANALASSGGGFVVAGGGEVLSLLALPLAGLMSLDPVENVVKAQRELHQAFQAVALRPESGDHPFMILSFLSLPVIPRLKLTDWGLVDVERFQIVSLWV